MSDLVSKVAQAQMGRVTALLKKNKKTLLVFSTFGASVSLAKRMRK
jgi:hypothetical protein